MPLKDIHHLTKHHTLMTYWGSRGTSNHSWPRH